MRNAIWSWSMKWFIWSYIFYSWLLLYILKNNFFYLGSGICCVRISANTKWQRKTTYVNDQTMMWLHAPFRKMHTAPCKTRIMDKTVMHPRKSPISTRAILEPLEHMATCAIDYEVIIKESFKHEAIFQLSLAFVSTFKEQNHMYVNKGKIIRAWKLLFREYSGAFFESLFTALEHLQ
jgi:hypothetical protein